jgi:hypothetical protein
LEAAQHVVQLPVGHRGNKRENQKFLEFNENENNLSEPVGTQKRQS